jgi:outer membrane protein OmpA-like peptidoglycan-associated protein
VSRLDRAYTLDEVRYNYSLRAHMRSVDVNTITFDSGSWEIEPSQFRKLETIARAIDDVLRDDPDEVFLIEGHTDATGEPEDNLTLSDRRAESVARVLTEEFGIPPENLTTQGYGEEFLKVPSSGSDERNRRVVIRRITPLVSESYRR